MCLSVMGRALLYHFYFTITTQHFLNLPTIQARRLTMNLPKAYAFETDDAIKYGVDIAILRYVIRFWVKQNELQNRNFYDGRYWTYNTKKKWAESFPFWSERHVRTVLESATKQGALITGNYNESAYDRTLWYALPDDGDFNCQSLDVSFDKNCPMDNPESDSPIPVEIPISNNPHKKTQYKTDNGDLEECIKTKWNEIAQQWGLACLRTVGSARLKNFKTLLAELDITPEAFFDELEHQVAVSLFLRGKRLNVDLELEDTDWRCTFDFLVEPRVKGPRRGIPVIEGRYQDPDLERMYQKRKEQLREIETMKQQVQ